MKLFLWKLSQDVNNGYETYDSAVVVSCGHSAASLIHPAGDKIEWNGVDWLWADDKTEFGMDDWAKPRQITVQQIGEAGPGLEEGDVICASFNAG